MFSDRIAYVQSNHSSLSCCRPSLTSSGNPKLSYTHPYSLGSFLWFLASNGPQVLPEDSTQVFSCLCHPSSSLWDDDLDFRSSAKVMGLERAFKNLPQFITDFSCAHEFDFIFYSVSDPPTLTCVASFPHTVFYTSPLLMVTPVSLEIIPVSIQTCWSGGSAC